MINFSSFPQTRNIKRQVDSLLYVEEVPYACEVLIIDETQKFNPDTFIYNIGCGDRLFWEAVKLKKDGIITLINKLDDPRKTPAVIPYCGNRYSVSDIAFTVLGEIIKDLPRYDDLVEFEPVYPDQGWCTYLRQLANDDDKRKALKKNMKKWYRQNKSKLIWFESNDCLTFDICSFYHPNGGHFELQK